MIRRLLLIAALTAGAAQAAPELLFRVGALAMDTAEGNAFTGVGLSFPLTDSLAITAEYDTTFVEFTVNGPFAVQVLDFTQYGAFLDYTARSDADFWATGRLGYVHNDAKFTNGSLSEDSPAVGFEFGWKHVGLAWNHAEVDDRKVDAYSLMFRFDF